MFKKIKIFLMLFFGVYVSFISCANFRNFFPLERIYYPVFGSGFNKEMVILSKYKDGRIRCGIFKPNEIVWARFDGLEIILLNIYDIDINLVANYSKSYLDFERQKNGNPKNEFWIAYEGGLVLIPEEYHKGDDWQEYIRSLKEK